MTNSFIRLFFCFFHPIGAVAQDQYVQKLQNEVEKLKEELQTEQECINACSELGYQYLGSWNGPGDFPKCTFTEGGNRVCHFNTSPVPGRTNVNSEYAAICKKA